MTSDVDDSSHDYRIDEFHLLRHQRRQNVIVVLLFSQADEISIAYLAELLAVLQTHDRPRALNTDIYNQTRQSLIKSHLDPLVEAGVITLNGNTITRGPAFDRYAALAAVQELLTRGLTQPE